MRRQRHTPWTAENIADQTGRTYIVTGANSGLGLETTRELAARGARVVMACRNEQKTEAARAELPDEVRANTEFRALDLADLDSVHSFADDLACEPIDVAIYNAGVMTTPFGHTAQGYEMQFGVNVLGHFALNQRIEEQVRERFVWLGSLMHKFGAVNLTDLNWESRKYNRVGSYGQAKLACVMLAYEQQRRFVRAGSTRRAMAAHPGYSATNLQSHSGNPVMHRIMALGNSIGALAQTPEMGALPTLYAATVPDLPGGTYVGPDGPAQLRGNPRPVVSSAASYDPEVATGLWERCAAMTAR